MATWDRLVVQAAEQTAHPTAVRAGGRVSAQIVVLKSVNSPFYRDVLGFNWDFGGDDYSVVWRDNSAIHFVKGHRSPTGVHLFQWVRDVDAYHREVVERGAEVIVEPADRPYHMRDFSIRDPNGIILVIGQDL